MIRFWIDLSMLHPKKMKSVLSITGSRHKDYVSISDEDLSDMITKGVIAHSDFRAISSPDLIIIDHYMCDDDEYYIEYRYEGFPHMEITLSLNESIDALIAMDSTRYRFNKKRTKVEFTSIEGGEKTESSIEDYFEYKMVKHTACVIALYYELVNNFLATKAA